MSLVLLCLSSVLYAERASALSLQGLLNLVYPPKSYPAGRSFPQLAAGYYKWLLPMDAARSPITDTTGEFCAEKQSGLVWYLANTLIGAGPVVRNCRIPAGRTLAFPVIGQAIVAAPGTMAPYNSEAYLRAAVDSFDPALVKLQVTLDGVDVPNPNRYFQKSEVFSFTIPTDTKSGLTPGFYSAGVDASFFFAVQPLLPGKHTLRFKGTLPNYEGATVDVTYNLTVGLLPF